MAIRKFLTLLIFIFLGYSAILFSCKKKGKKNPEACNGKGRREVKLLTDEAAAGLDTSASFTTIGALGEISVPGKVKGETGRLDLEKKTYTVKCIVDKVAKERDGDYHLRLKDGDNYLIAEAANPGCDYAASSTYHAAFETAYNFIKENDLEGKTVYVTGVAFVDIDHYYKRKQAKNNLELHPILKIHF
jgi:hypothetical protein